ncbi:MAG: adenylosuccinate synthetase [Clostridiaceae bacterium]|jgi:adenylosuccinate synthase|nr:adenylosuccinate synthetase [Clostridiaceae bacterium]
MLSAIVGINWGDEGKGRMVDLLSSGYDVIVRYQGGNNAGHTVVNDKGKFILNLLPSGILRDTTVNVMGNGMVIDLEHLCKEIRSLADKGIKVAPSNLIISDRATICMPFHRLQDVLEEKRLADKKYGSTQRGIAPVYADKYIKKGIRMGDLLNFETLYDKVKDILEWKNLMLSGYSCEEIELGAMMEWLETYGLPLVPFVQDVTEYMVKAVREKKNIMFEAQLGAHKEHPFQAGMPRP